MTKAELKALCIFMMCHDDHHYADERVSVVALANRFAVLYGYLDWVDAYHKL